MGDYNGAHMIEGALRFMEKGGRLYFKMMGGCFAFKNDDLNANIKSTWRRASSALLAR